MYILRKCTYRDIEHIIRKHRKMQQYCIIITCTEVKKVMMIGNVLKLFCVMSIASPYLLNEVKLKWGTFLGLVNSIDHNC